ncbi:bifunctional lysylphosphatidylglycerol flippase/synthetase MprF [uncultured Amaricoccus sp.]|uniref:bifunctional lysylphosphatidylglycerol flippase/synthetase MprF n=1 Tax=uncultured Amaricoccus sp. TaxID=339341 RepID=UPI0026128D39|nr:bifunctional lysylphosphatidylglycerol flippase/synthetase MprF [uncultured Amaricoccus sp.]
MSASDAADEPRSRGRAALDDLRRLAPVFVTLALFALGLYALHRLLAPLDFEEVLAKMRATPARTFALAIGATALGYAALVGYDWTAMRYIGRRLPLPVVALGGFLAYAFGNTIGLSALSGGAVRYRIYTSLGLDGYEVAVISSYVAVAYGVGATLIGLGALALHPGALMGITAIPPDLLRPISLGILAASVGIIVFVSARGGSLRIWRFELGAPRLGDLGWQICFCLIDITMASAALFVLLPTAGMEFSTFVVVFAVATMVGVISHVPGGVGVFESVIIAALGSSVPVNEAVSGLLLFRLIYYLLPFVVALVLLSASEIWTARARGGAVFARLAPILRAGQTVIPLAMGILVLGSGLLMMFSGLLRNPALTADRLERLLPLVMMEGGALLSSIVGSALVVLAHGIFRRSRAAFWLVLAALSVGIVAALLHGNDIDRALILLALALLLLPCRREFYRAAPLTQGVLSAQWVLLTIAIVASITATYLVAVRSAPYASAMWWEFTLADGGPRAQRAALAGSVFLTLGLLVAAMRTRHPRWFPSDPAALGRARGIIEAHGTARDLVAVTGDKRLMFSEDGEAVLSYGLRGASWIALGAPVGTPEACETLAWSFHDAARAAGARPVFYEAPPRFGGQSVEMGLALHRMSEEALVPLLGFSLDGPGRAGLWACRARGRELGVRVEFLPPPRADALVASLRGISDAWLSARGGRERRFAMGRFDEAYIRRFPVAVARREGEYLAFANILTAGRTAAIDLARCRPSAPPETLEFLLLAIMLDLAAKGFQEISLGTAPLAGGSGRRDAELWHRFAAIVLRRVPGADGQRAFLARFQPSWRPRYLCCRSVLPPTGPLADAAMLIAGSSKGIGTS